MLPFFFPGTTDPTEGAQPPLLLYNTLSRTKERFTPLHDDYVRMYNCGPTVYDYAHIGNLRAYVFADILRRTLVLNGYKVMQVVNITDVGHLTSDADDGDDKMTVGLRREGLPLTLEGMKQLSDIYAEAWLTDLDNLNIKRPSAIPRASAHISADIALIETLMQKEYAYRTPDGVYFDTSKFTEYGKLGGITVDMQKEGARVQTNEHKRNPADFALWKRNDELGWESKWGRGFPGWHIECSAMAMEHLGKELDIHTGGIDHIGTHHNNEIAQSEAATGKPFARYWMHNAFVNIEGTKFSKSLRNTISLHQLKEHGHDPIAYRYWLLTGHYRTPMNFSFTALEGSQTALKRLQRFFVEELVHARGGRKNEQYALEFKKLLNDDLDTPSALALLWKLIKDEQVTNPIKRATLLHFDKVLGIGLEKLAKSGAEAVTIEVLSLNALPNDIRALVDERETARKEKLWLRADELRVTLKMRGFAVEDSAEGPKVTRV
ncbi:MAG: cysteine--tRNA ligase [Candidatus Pacebacteria bacterium]|nr:cysteine--tRNA ligase [Candidatus Paceibacterota bacterium]